MESSGSSSFQSQMLSVMEVLAKAAVAEINRRVDDSCAVIRLEVSQSRRDIDVLKRKCELMEAELRRARMRVRRKACYPPASPLIKVILSKETQDAAWDRQTEAGAPHQPQQSIITECVTEAAPVQIKEEFAEDDMWKKNPQDKLMCGAEQLPRLEASQAATTDGFSEHYHPAENPADPEPLVFPTDSFDAFEQQQLGRHQSEAELLVKQEEEPDASAVPLESHHKSEVEEGDAQVWSSSLSRDAGDPSFSYAGHQYEQLPSVHTSQSGEHLKDAESRNHSAAKAHFVVASAARAKRRARTFAFKRPQLAEGHNALSQINPTDQSSIPAPSQLQYRDSAPPMRILNQDFTSSSPAALVSCGHGRSSFALARRMRTPWRSGVCEKRFSCTYCDKSFMRFSQLKEHLRSHTGEKPFSCLQCGRSFTKQCNLIRHAVVHSGEKPYECSLCGKCFTQRSSLKSHQKTAH